MALCRELLVGVDDSNGFVETRIFYSELGDAFGSVRSWKPDIS